eukprot:TRINITY_DN2705_c0_g2_i17.p1 TRINITY_DN2705_c0_g2~~TRINITY_DN2705_c0_g2_i17.p1  ORF type:complete len:190 (-),score=35.70 TRINITY_DN2705_c0_g2_i17:100-669(-)
MEHAPKGTLKTYLVNSQCNLHLDLVFKLVIGIASGIRALHKQGIIHRDIAARNFLLSEEMLPKISDFGLSRVIPQDEEYNSTGMHLLPLKWMAPESLKNQIFTRMTDIWSFGITVWEIITKGSNPHEDLYPAEAKIQIRDNFLKPEIPAITDPTLTLVMKQCWYNDPDVRPTAYDIVEMIQDVTDSVLC